MGEKIVVDRSEVSRLLTRAHTDRTGRAVWTVLLAGGLALALTGGWYVGTVGWWPAVVAWSVTAYGWISQRVAGAAMLDDLAELDRISEPLDGPEAN